MPKQEKYYLYIDDTGSRQPDYVEKTRKDGLDCFGLGGILIKDSDRALLEEQYGIFCNKWNITYPLRSSDIRGARGNFRWLADETKNDEFIKDLGNFLCNLPVIGFATIIHRPVYNSRYKDKYKNKRWLMCKTAYCILIERTLRYVREHGGVLSIKYERTGPSEDKLIESYAKELKKKGSPFDPKTSKKYGPLTTQDFAKGILGDPRKVTKSSMNVQIADMYLFPMAKGGYDPDYIPFHLLIQNKQIINALLNSKDIGALGIKYSCFEGIKSKKPRKT